VLDPAFQLLANRPTSIVCRVATSIVFTLFVAGVLFV